MLLTSVSWSALHRWQGPQFYEQPYSFMNVKGGVINNHGGTIGVNQDCAKATRHHYHSLLRPQEEGEVKAEAPHLSASSFPSQSEQLYLHLFCVVTILQKT